MEALVDTGRADAGPKPIGMSKRQLDSLDEGQTI
jgi:hypothetical protein